MCYNRENEKEVFYQWHIKFLMNASAAELANLLAPSALLQKAMENMRSTLTLASPAVLVQMVAPSALSPRNNS